VTNKWFAETRWSLALVALGRSADAEAVAVAPSHQCVTSDLLVTNSVTNHKLKPLAALPLPRWHKKKMGIDGRPGRAAVGL
jgi:hypothetical protein